MGRQQQNAMHGEILCEAFAMPITYRYTLRVVRHLPDESLEIVFAWGNTEAHHEASHAICPK